ncbi:hypothetical protein SUGI_0268450 [Cryptomeria japonica]|nr:hypothetical protein SUGI_0268450 [Cryptomeria japonica]
MYACFKEEARIGWEALKLFVDMMEVDEEMRRAIDEAGALEEAGTSADAGDCSHSSLTVGSCSICILLNRQRGALVAETKKYILYSLVFSAP